MEIYREQTFDEERALYGKTGVKLLHCRFDGPADGESALKESRDIEAQDCFFNLRYPFWHDEHVQIKNGELTQLCRAALWYSRDIHIDRTKLHGIKALRECADVTIENCDVISPEFGWSVKNIKMSHTAVQGEYFMLRSEQLRFEHVTLQGKYSFQYVENAEFTDCELSTKDAFWHTKNVTVKNSVLRGEYLAWYSENLTLENCTIIGTQPFCYCKGLRLINCRMLETDLAFEKSEVEAEVTTVVDSIKNPRTGTIKVAGVKEIIMDDAQAKGQIIVSKAADCA